MTDVDPPRPSQLLVANAASLSHDSKTETTTKTSSINVKIKRSSSSFALNKLSFASSDSSPLSLFQRRIFSSPNDYSSTNSLSQVSTSTSPESFSLSSSSTPPSPTSSVATSPNATTISSQDGSSSVSRSLNLASPDNLSLYNYGTGSSSGFITPIKRRSSRYSAIHRKSMDSTSPPKDEYSREFKILDEDLSKFQSKSGVNRSNVLRLALLPFLRQHRGEENYVKHSNAKELYYYRVKILQKWWNSILAAFKDRSISGSDRSLYLEGLSGLMARLEWRSNPILYQQLLYETMQLVISKLSLKTVPLSVAAFSGKVLAYAFFFAPGIAPILLHLLAVPQHDIDRVISCTFRPDNIASDSASQQFYHHQQPFASCASISDATLILTSTCNFPKHLEPLLGYCEGRKSPAALPSKSTTVYNASRFYKSIPAPHPPSAVPNIYGPWSRRWASSNSDVFIAFIKHYYSIISSILPQDLPWNAHVASPGLVILHSFLLGSLDFAVHPHDDGHANASG
ncbi:hypothetical protein AWJ20_1286 [Sugiyamaella lignohabitans]|uniref:Uncharacterized protein n=1 Tax=Sugiyamaella lignohabitans TaxID=796027 RepID=A0A167DKC4_9ASCO|nr:uncharacterized protein AWJ20_1286 [Sugiyamaella lignohabitans]ANB13008.1 hypothetical protein AWJ20_1286 [Sugiyamaella lignohabitans]